MFYHLKSHIEFRFKNNFSSGGNSHDYKSYEYKQNWSYKYNGSDQYKQKYRNHDDSSIHTQSELFRVLLSGSNESYEAKNPNICRSSSEKFDNHHALMQKLLNPNSISCSLFDESDKEDKLSENEENSSENEDSIYSSELENEEDFDENEINELEEPKSSKFNNKDAYLKYLSSINSQHFEMQNINEELEIKFGEAEQRITQDKANKQSKRKHHRIPKTKKEIYKISKMNKLMYKQKRKAVTNKENRDEENKMDKTNILELLNECSLEEGSNNEEKHQYDIKSKGNFKSQIKKEHLNNNSYEFIKSIGWANDKKLFGHSKHYSREYDSYQFEQSRKQSWNKI